MSDKIYVPDTDQVRHAGVSTYTYKQFDLWLASVKAEAWDEGVATALNYAKRNPDGITLRLERHDGKPWPHPYRSEDN